MTIDYWYILKWYLCIGSIAFLIEMITEWEYEFVGINFINVYAIFYSSNFLYVQFIDKNYNITCTNIDITMNYYVYHSTLKGKKYT